jgi:hypothetical protein
MSGSSECKVCGAVIYWDEEVRSKIPPYKKIPLDAGGAYHKHREKGEARQQELEQDEGQTPIVKTEIADKGYEPGMSVTKPDQSLAIAEAKQQATMAVDERRSAIEKAHLENMEASKNLVNAIENLVGEAATLSRSIGDFKEFIGKVVHQFFTDPAAHRISDREAEEYHKHNNEDASA